MQVVAFPDVEGTFQLACKEVLDQYFSTGNTSTVGGLLTNFMQTELHFDIDKVKPTTLPRFCIVGTRTAEVYMARCQTPGGDMLRTKRQSLQKTAYLSIPRKGPMRIKTGAADKLYIPSWEFALELWSQFSLVFSTQQQAFAARGIMEPKLVISPVQGSDIEFLVLIGAFSCNVEFSYLME